MVTAGRDAHERATLNAIEDELALLRTGIEDSEEIQYVNGRYQELTSTLISDASICAAGDA